MLIKTKYIDCASKSIFNTWRLPTSASDLSGDIYWSSVVYIQETGEMWTHGKLYGGFFSNSDSNKVNLTIGGTEKILSLDGHVHSYTSLTGSGDIANQAILTTGETNKWALKTLGKNAFSNDDYLLKDGTAALAEKVVNPLRLLCNNKDIYSFDGSASLLLNIILGTNIIITEDGQGTITISATDNDYTVDTSGATNLINKKLFLVGAESQDLAPKTYSNEYIYVGTDNCLYSSGKKVSTIDHIHNYAGSLTPGGPADNIAGGTKGSIPYLTKSGKTSMLAPAAVNGYVLKFNSETGLPYWAPDINTTYITKVLKVNNTSYDVYTSSASLPTIWAPTSLGTANLVLKVNSTGDGLTWGTDNNTDTKVLLSETTTTNYRPLILGYTNATSSSELNPSVTEQVYVSKLFYVKPNTGELWATKLYSGNSEVLTKGNYTSILDAKYVKKVGDTMTGALTISSGGLTVSSTAGNGTKIVGDSVGGWVQFGTISANPTNKVGTISAYGGADLTSLNVRIANDGFTVNSNPILHKGNYATILDTRYVTIGTSQTITGTKTFANIVLPTGKYIYGNIIENGGGILFFDGTKTVLGSIGESTTSSTHIRSISGHATVGTSNSALYTILDTGNYTSTLDTRYVKKSGDTMTGSLIIGSADGLFLVNGGDTGARVFRTSDNELWLQANSNAAINLSAHSATKIRAINLLTDNATVNGSKIWHSGNDGSDSGLDADLLDGYHVTSIQKRFDINIPTGETIDVDEYTKSNSLTQEAGNIFSVAGWAWDRSAYIRLAENITLDRMRYSIISYRNGNINNLWQQQALLFLPTYDDSSTIYLAQMYTTGGSTVYTHIKRYADYDTILASNVASATKLQTPRTIWGQRFDGTGNVSGSLTGVADITSTRFYLRGSNTNPLLRLSNDTVSAAYLQLTTSGVLSMDFGSSSGKNISLVYSNGYVGIGTISPSYKLHVAGTLYASGAATLGSTLSVSSYIYSKNGWFQNNKSSTGLYNSAHDARWYANANGWYSDKAATFAGTVTSSGFKKSSSSDSYILLGGGGHKALSNIVGGSGQSNHGSQSTAYTADTYSSTYVNKSYAAFATRGGWSYVDNGYITTDFGNINLAGTAIFQWGASNTSKTQLFITPLNSSGVSSPLLGEMLYYSSNGSGYAAGWTRVLTSRNYSGILDSRYVNVAGDTMTGALTINSEKNNVLIINGNSQTDNYPYMSIRLRGTQQGAYSAYNYTPYFYQGGWRKMWHEGNDGSGSGLDADTVDGVHNGNLKAKYLVTEGDNRGTNTSPKDYINDIIFRGLKTNSAINSPNSDVYSYLVGLKGWTDSSGGGSHELAFNNQGIYSRIATSETAWGTWKKLAFTTDTVAAANKLTVNAGSATRPVYFANGIPVAGTYTFGNANGNAAINNGTVCTNLNADLLDGKHAYDFYNYGYVMFKNTIDASALDVNTYYPVTFNIGTSSNVRIECRVALDSGTKPSWSTHSNGFSVRKIWETNGSGWGTNPVNRRILVSDYAFADTDPVRGIGQLTSSSREYVYVRGGGKYYFYISHNIDAVLRTSIYTINNQSVSPITSAPAAITRNITMSGDVVSNADTVDGYHASGLFTGFSNSGSSLSITIGGTTKTLAPAYASTAGSASSATFATYAGKVRGEYTGSGGQQNPNYFGVNWVGFRMMNTTVNGNSDYKDWIISDCYSGNDIGGAVAFGINRQTLGAYIMGSDAARTSWTRSGEFWGTWNFNPNTKFNTSGGTISGDVTINNTLSVKSIKSTTTYSSNYVFCADGSIRNFPTLFSTNILWASYKVNTGGSGSYSRLSGNYTFITGGTRLGTGKLIVTISVPSGYSKTQIMMFATGHHRENHWDNPIYASIQPDYGVDGSVRIMTADDSSLNDAECIVNFILVKTS